MLGDKTKPDARLDRRSFLFGSAAGLGVMALGGCATNDGLLEAQALYGPLPNEKFPVPAVDISKLDPKYYRKTVAYDSKEAPGTIVVDPANYYVYRIEGDGAATRYGANVGRQGFLWSGEAYVGRKSEWPVWTPPWSRAWERAALVSTSFSTKPGWTAGAACIGTAGASPTAGAGKKGTLRRRLPAPLSRS